MPRARKPKNSTSVKVNFKGVESRQTPAEGDYLCEILEANAKQSQGGGDMIEFISEIAEGKYKGTKLWFYCPLDEKSLWKLHAFLTALGEDVPDEELDIDLPELIGNQFVGVLSHETYQGRKRAKLTDFSSVDDYDGELASAGGDDDDDDADDKKSKKGKSSKKDDKKSKKDEAPDYDDMDEDELRDLYLERELGTKKEAKKLDEDELKEALEEADKAAAKSSKKGKKSKDEDEDDDDDKKSSKGKKGAKDKKGKKPKKVLKSDVEDMDEDELQELIDAHDLDVDLEDKKLKKLEKKVAAVCEALEDADLLEDDDD